MEKQYNHQTAEQDAQRKWELEKTYTAAHNPGPLYSVDTPPPTVSGNLHIGHIFSYTQTDIVARYKRMSGYSVFYPFGFDDNGLPTERYVEKKLEISAHKLSRSEFIRLCLQETEVVETQFKHLWQRMGLSVDWSLCYSTISELTRKISQESFILLYKKGFIYRKNEPALYCTTCHTSVAQAELDDAQKPSVFYDIAFKDEQGNDLVIGTTRPEMLPACVALFYHPDDKRYAPLKGKNAVVPVYNFTVPILADEKVNPEKGTGLVMCCTFGDKTDIEWYKKHKLPYKQVLGFDGKFTANTGALAGLSVFHARAKIVQLLQELGVIKDQKNIMHAVNIHERCKKEIELLMLPQWFLNLLSHKKEYLAIAERINWYPKHMKSRYVNWVENLGWDWCLSRQRFYGIPFPVWHCQDCSEIILPELMALPVDPQELTYEGACPRCASKNITPDTDVMDTWNTSSLTPYLCYALYNPGTHSPFTDTHIKDFMPMSMRPQAHDIIRTWAFYTIVKAWMHHEDIPWHDIVISGHVLADSKEKLSKSKENATQTPQGLLERFPADAIRYWTASGGLGQDIAFSEPQLKIGLRLITKMWNAFKFIQEHINIHPERVEGRPEKPKTELGLLNEWLLHTAMQTFADYQTYMNEHEFGLALARVEKFFWHNFCDNYLELIKDQLFNPGNYTEQEVAATRWTLHTVGLRILQLYAPYLPHITETLYGTIYQAHTKTNSIHQTRFKEMAQFEFEQSAQLMESVITIIEQARKLKSEKQLSLKVPFASMTILSDDEHLLHHIMPHTQLIKGVTHAAEIHFKAAGDAVTQLVQENEQWHATIFIKKDTHA